MPQLENIETIETRLWSSADTLRANSNYASNEYFMPVMGLVFLRHAYSRFLKVKSEIDASLPKRGGQSRPISKEDFSGKGALYLEPKAQFDYLVGLKDSEDRAKALIEAMELIEKHSETLQGVLPKAEYQELDNSVLGQLLRTFNDQALREASGDVFGRIYEYFLTKFADLKAHDGGEFFTPIALVQMIVNVIEPTSGTVLDPACGSGGMFVQSAHFVEHLKQNPSEKLTFYGLEKNPTTIRLAKMNLAVHGLEGNIEKAITYYEDPHELARKADYVMANPPFNVDEVDAERVKNDPRLPFGLPGVNKKGKVSNGNYLWISYFNSYLNSNGRAGFIMSSQASSAGRDEAEVRRKLIESGDVDVMMAIRSNFFYTRTVPCELWFLDRNKPKEKKAKVLMIDARHTYRKVTRKIYDFSPEQLKNLSCIVWLYRGQKNRFVELVASYLQKVDEELRGLSKPYESFNGLLAEHSTDIDALPKDHKREIQKTQQTLKTDFADLFRRASTYSKEALKKATSLKDLTEAYKASEPLAESCRDLVKQVDFLFNQLSKAMDADNGSNGEKQAKRELKKKLRTLDDARKVLVEQLKMARYFQRQAHWLLEKFPEGELRDVEGLVKVVSQKQLEENDWSLSAGRYVGVAPEEEDEDFDFEETLRGIHAELKELNQEAVVLAEKIQKNYEGLGV